MTDQFARLRRIPRPEAELRAALSAACHGKWRMCVPPQVDDHDMVIGDGITELIALRALLTEAAAALAPLRAQYVQPGAAGDTTVMVRFTAEQARLGKRVLAAIEG